MVSTDLDTSQRKPDWAEFRWYMGGHSSYFAAMGIQGIVYPYIVTFVLAKPADMVGIAQMFTMLPMFGLVLLGGMTADRRELRMHLVRLQFLAAIPMLVLSGLIFTENLTFTLLILCGIATGAVGAFVMPARDSLLNRVARRSPSGDIQQAVTSVTAIQFGAQLFGILLAGQLVSDAGAGVMLLVLVVSYLSAAFCTTNVDPAPPSIKLEPDDIDLIKVSRWRKNFQDINEGIQEVRNSKRMLPVVTLIFFGGLLMMGVISVLLQVLIRDEYQGDIGIYSNLMIAFTVGVTLTTTILSRYFKVVRQGRTMMLAFAFGALILSAIHFKPPLELLYVLMAAWGGASGINMSMSRSIVQEAAKASHRARIMSVYQLGFLGGAPLGSLGIGFVTDWLGPLDAVLVVIGGIALVWLGLFFFTGLWHVKREQPVAS